LVERYGLISLLFAFYSPIETLFQRGKHC
jgi:hypothetical protein